MVAEFLPVAISRKPSHKEGRSRWDRGPRSFSRYQHNRLGLSRTTFPKIPTELQHEPPNVAWVRNARKITSEITLRVDDYSRLKGTHSFFVMSWAAGTSGRLEDIMYTEGGSGAGEFEPDGVEEGVSEEYLRRKTGEAALSSLRSLALTIDTNISPVRKIALGYDRVH